MPGRLLRLQATHDRNDRKLGSQGATCAFGCGQLSRHGAAPRGAPFVCAHCGRGALAPIAREARTKRADLTHETVSNLGVVWVGLITADRGSGMKWRVMVELTGSDGVVRSQEVSAGGSNASECSAATVGLTLADGKRTMAGLPDHLVRAQADEYYGFD